MEQLEIPQTVDQSYLNQMAYAISDEMLKFCPCIDPKGSLRFIQRGLELLARRAEGISLKMKGAQLNIHLAQCKKNELLFFGNQGALEYFIQTMWRDGFLEHDGSVLPGMLSSDGTELLERLEHLEREQVKFNMRNADRRNNQYLNTNSHG